MYEDPDYSLVACNQGSNFTSETSIHLIWPQDTETLGRSMGPASCAEERSTIHIETFLC